MRKVAQILFGPFRYTKTPTAVIDGGMAEYTFRQFQPFPPVDVIGGRSNMIYRRDPVLQQGGLFVVAPVGSPFDVTKVEIGGPSLDPNLIEEEMLP